MSDEAPEAPVDNAANFCSWLIVITGVMLLVAIYTMQNLLATQYNMGWFKS